MSRRISRGLWAGNCLALSLVALGACATPIAPDVDSSGDDSTDDDSSVGSGGTPSTGGRLTTGGSVTATGGAPASTGGAPAATGGAASGGGTSTSCPAVAGDENFQAAYISGDVSDSTAYVNSTLKIVKVGTAVPLADLKLRYYFTNEVPVDTPATVSINWTQPLGGLNGTYTTTAEIVPMTVAGTDADYYVEFSFSGPDLSGAIKFAWQMAAPNPIKFDQTDDYSFGPLTGSSDTDFTPMETLVLLHNGVVVWGTPPC